MPPRKKVNATTYISNPVATATATATATGENIAFSVTPVANSTESNAATFADAADLVTPDQFQKGNVNKKRGRKPKGGKIMTNISSSNTEISEIPNIILHLKCCLQDILSSNIQIGIEPYVESTGHEEFVIEDENIPISQKLKNLAIKLHSNDMNITKTDCFWCT